MDDDVVRGYLDTKDPRKLGIEERTKLLEEAFALRSEATRLARIDVLAGDGSRDTVDRALLEIKSSDPLRRHIACDLLYQPGYWEGMPYWRECLDAVLPLLTLEEDYDVVDAAMFVLQGLSMEADNEDIFDALLEALPVIELMHRHPYRLVRREAAMTLHHLAAHSSTAKDSLLVTVQ